ncbi:MAG: ABC transporter permease [Lachnospiraceae bacterium]|nr:ABC transporter permease [Lachnospiraceae bacterium]
MKNKFKNKDFNLIVGLILAAVVIIPAVVGIFWTPYDTEAMSSSLKLSGSSLAHPMGCDNFGRDILSRVMSGSSTTLLIGLGTVLIGAVAGTLIGALTGYYGGLVDDIFMRFNDVMFSFPSLLLALVFVAVMGSGRMQLLFALGIAFIPSYVRIVRAEYVRARNLDYVKSAKLAGASDIRVMFVHILPNTVKVLINSVLIGFNNAVLAEAGLSFLGIGVQPPDASLGRMLADSQTYLFNRPGMAVAPGITLIVMVLGISLLGKSKLVTER